jgi:hypothetical protein
MKIFLLRVVQFFLVSNALLCLIYSIGFVLPTTPRAKQSLLFSETYKDSLLVNTPAPRIIFVGGSNIAFGINGFMIKDSLQLNTINTGISAAIGLQYYFKHVLPFIREDDIVLLIPEYHHFVRNYDDGSHELLRMAMDVNRDNFRLFSMMQIVNLLPYMPAYSFSKLNFNSYHSTIESGSQYQLDAFDRFGGVKDSLMTKKQEFLPFEVSGNFNKRVIAEIKKFEEAVKNKNAVLYLSYPAYQDESFKKWAAIIKKIQTEFESNSFQIMGTPERYIMPDSMLFDTPYHCNRKGINYITGLRINDIRRMIIGNE